MNTAEYTHRVLIAVGITLTAVIITFLLVTAADVFLVIFGGILFAVLLRALEDVLERHTPLSAGWSLAFVVLGLAVLLGAAGYFLTAEVTSQFDQLGKGLGQSWQELKGKLESTAWGRQLLALMAGLPTAPEQNGDLLSQISSVFSTTLGAIGNFFIVVFLGIYFAADPGWYRRGMLRMLPRNQRERCAEVLDEISTALRWWLIGRFASMLIVGIVTTIGLMLLGIPVALALGSIAFLFDFVPFLGPVVAATPAILIALTMGTTQALYVVLLYLVIQTLEGYVLTPLIEQRSVRLPPALTIGMLVLLGLLAGTPGVLLATPLTVVLAVLIKKLYVEDTLENKEVSS